MPTNPQGHPPIPPRPVPPSPPQPPRPQPVPSSPPQPPRPQTVSPSPPQPSRSQTVPPISVPSSPSRPAPQQPQVRYTYTDPAPPASRYPAANPRPGMVPYEKPRKKSKVPPVLIGGWLVLCLIGFPTVVNALPAAVFGGLVIFLISRALRRRQTNALPPPTAPPPLQQPPVPVPAQAQTAAQTTQTPQAIPVPQPKPETDLAGIPAEARNYLLQLRQADVAIQDPAVSEKIRQLETRTRQIFRVVSENPGRLPEIRRFMDYYLPTLLKLLRSYDRLEDQKVEGENIGRSMREIERSLDSAVQAFDKQLDNLFEAEALDISSDIQVLETMLSQEGLLSRDFPQNGENASEIE